MNAETDWTALMNAWLYPPETDTRDDPLGIRRRVKATARRMTFAALSEYAVAALLISLAVWKMASNGGLDAFVLGFAMLWFTAMALQFSAHNRRGLWQPAGSRRVPISTSRSNVCDDAKPRSASRGCSTRRRWCS